MEFTVPPMVSELVKEGRVSVTALFLKSGIDAYCTVETPLDGVPVDAGKTVLPLTLEEYLQKRKQKKDQKALTRQESLFKKLQGEIEAMDIECDEATSSRDFVQLEKQPKKASYETRLAVARELNRKMYAQRRKWEETDRKNGEPFFAYHPMSDSDTLFSLRWQHLPNATRFNVARHIHEHVLTEDVVPGMTLADAEARIKARDIGSHVVIRDDGEKIVNILPLKSLCLADQERGRESRADLQARVIKVTSMLGPDTILGRIRSTEALRVRGASTLEEWWTQSDGKQRFDLLTDKKNRDSFIGVSMDYMASMYAMLFKQPCPFLGAEHLLV